mgnify:CR=1 FL=1
MKKRSIQIGDVFNYTAPFGHILYHFDVTYKVVGINDIDTSSIKLVVIKNDSKRTPYKEYYNIGEIFDFTISKSDLPIGVFCSFNHGLIIYDCCFVFKVAAS